MNDKAFDDIQQIMEQFNESIKQQMLLLESEVKPRTLAVSVTELLH